MKMTLFLRQGHSMSSDLLHTVYGAFERLLLLQPDEIIQVGVLIPIPSFDTSVHAEIYRQVSDSFQHCTPMIKVSTPCTIIGDIHGNFHDLLRIFVSIPDPMSQRYLFLGDYVDRGCYSVDVVLLLFTLYLLYPAQFFFIRGNHEFKAMIENYGLKAEIIGRFGNEDLWIELDHVFSYFPLAAIVGNSIFCVHGGIGPDIVDLNTIRGIQLPVETYDDQVISQLVWSDPSKDIGFFESNVRGIGWLFGSTAVNEFLQAVKMKIMVRAHQCVTHGLSVFAQKCITVFSTSDYHHGHNCAGYLRVSENEEIEHKVLNSVTFVTFSEAQFTKIEWPLKKPQTAWNVPGLLKLPRGRFCGIRTVGSELRIAVSRSFRDSVFEERTATISPIVPKLIPLLRRTSQAGSA
jgi:diadenosine tetraphosphatase ApaH/serine/threonine PP2A family protein phosphatase